MAGNAPCPDHNHHHCITDALDRAETLCRRRKLRLTPIRRRVLELVWESHRPAKAYDLLSRLGAEGWGSAPPVVYRALGFLQEQGLVHHLATRNAYVGCSHGGTRHDAQFLICDQCEMIVELHDDRLDRRIQAAAADCGFEASDSVIEVQGRCAACRDSRVA